MSSDYLEAAKEALEDALRQEPGSDGERRLLHVADVHARIAQAEAARALVGVIVALPVTDTPDEPTEGEEGWRDTGPEPVGDWR